MTFYKCVLFIYSLLFTFTCISIDLKVITTQYIDLTKPYYTYENDVESVARYRGYKTLWKPFPRATLTSTEINFMNKYHINAFTWRRTLSEYSQRDERSRDEFLRQGSYTRVTWDGPSKWYTPKWGSFLMWKWTTTNGTTMPFRENFYDFLIDHCTSVAGTTEHLDPLPTLRPVSGVTRVWRFWSLSTNNNSKDPRIDTYLALETQGRPFSTSKKPTSSTMGGKLADNTAVVLCYVCGLNKPGIPRQPKCYNMFDNPDRWLPDKRHKYRKICYTGTGGHDRSRWYGPILTTNEMKGGCFKRFTDVGHVYTERGCRTWPPTRGMSFASKRFADLEALTKNTHTGCFVSPHASLTPFNRGISLYVRYHVCVCTGDLCNGNSKQTSFVVTSLVISLLIALKP